MPDHTPKLSHWTPDEDKILKSLYLTQEHEDIAKLLGRTRAGVRNRCYRLGLLKKPLLSEQEKSTIRQWYTDHKDSPLEKFGLKDLSKLINRRPNVICRFARSEGLTKMNRPPSDEWSQEHTKQMRDGFRKIQHPRGMLGKRHTDQFKIEQSKRVRKHQAQYTTADWKRINRQAVKTKIEKYGTGNPAMQGQNAYSRTKSGKREDLDNRFFRSSWEANYARYLNWLKSQRQIDKWEYEPQTFVFHGVTRGVLTYTPDFKVFNLDGSHEWHEVKGWMDAKSKAKLKRMKKFYPDETVIVIGEGEYKAVAKWKEMFPGWEEPEKKSRKVVFDVEP